MSTIKMPLRYSGTNGEKYLYTLFDSGANLSCINPSLIDGIENPIQFASPKRLITASEDHYIEVNGKILLEFFIDDVQLSDEFFLVPQLSEEAIIGAATLQKWRIKLDFEHNRVSVHPNAGIMQLKGYTIHTPV